jgi:hypothetical protein
MLESNFKSNLIAQLEDMFEGCLILVRDGNTIQGFPDLLILYKKKWAALECKRSKFARHRPNQDYYVDLLGQMSFASFIYPENKEEILYELQCTFKPSRATRISKC